MKHAVSITQDSPKPFSGRKTGLFFRNCWQHARPSACPPLLGQGPILLALRGGDGDAEARGKGGSAKDDAEEFERAITELERAKSSGMPLNATSFNNVLTLCWKGGGWKQALELLGEMKRTPGVKPDQRTYNAVMGALARAGQHAIVVCSPQNRHTHPTFKPARGLSFCSYHSLSSFSAQ
jgi:hypothetical protein